jgi:hypothetical protein
VSADEATTAAHKTTKKTRMKRSIAARKPAQVSPAAAAEQIVHGSTLPAVDAQPKVGSKEKVWEIDGPEGVPAPVIRANMISFRVSYQGRVQVAFFEEE